VVAPEEMTGQDNNTITMQNTPANFIPPPFERIGRPIKLQ